MPPGTNAATYSNLIDCYARSQSTNEALCGRKPHQLVTICNGAGHPALKLNHYQTIDEVFRSVY